MKSTDEILREVAALSVRERAAAIAHYIYMMTAERSGWQKRVPVAWNELSTDAREFNLASTDTWAREAALYEAWCDALRQLRRAPQSDAG
jgi:hypothetical protein